MTYESQAVLYGIKKMTNNNSVEFGYELGATCFKDDDGNIYDYSRYDGEIQSIIDQLVDEDYIKMSAQRYHFVLTQKAIHLHEDRVKRARNLILKSVVVPVVVSIVTSLITLWLQGLLV